MKTINKDHTALIKDLEAQIDYLVGYQPTGAHYKQEWYIRETLINETLASDDVPESVRTKINNILQALSNLRNGQPVDQSYLEKYHHRTIPIKSGGILLQEIEIESLDKNVQFYSQL